MIPENNAPATKHDISSMMEQIGEYYAKSELRMAEWKDEIQEQIVASEARTKEHFDLVAENLKHDFVGAFHDKVQQHEDRLVRLEMRSGMRPV